MKQSPWCPGKEHQESASSSKKEQLDRTRRMHARDPPAIECPESCETDAGGCPNVTEIGHYQPAERKRQCQKKVDAGCISPDLADSARRQDLRHQKERLHLRLRKERVIDQREEGGDELFFRLELLHEPGPVNDRRGYQAQDLERPPRPHSGQHQRRDIEQQYVAKQ